MLIWGGACATPDVVPLYFKILGKPLIICHAFNVHIIMEFYQCFILAVSVKQGGYFLWMKLPSPLKAAGKTALHLHVCNINFKSHSLFCLYVLSIHSPLFMDSVIDCYYILQML